VEDLVRAQLAHFADLVGLRIALHGPKLRLSATAAQAIGLALHELATNAGKYGALSVSDGCIDVGWGFDNDMFEMSWIEHNGPLVLRPARPGFGSTVIVSVAQGTIGCEAELDFAPPGVTWRVTCPRANVLQSTERDADLAA
jgi:two-component sensor histidine kinase